MAKKRAIHQHVHVGAGAFGLGFVIPLVAKAGFRTIPTNRARGSIAHHTRNVLLQQHGSYDLVLVGKKERYGVVSISDFIFLDENQERFFAIVADPQTCLLTTDLR